VSSKKRAVNQRFVGGQVYHGLGSRGREEAASGCHLLAMASTFSMGVRVRPPCVVEPPKRRVEETPRKETTAVKRLARAHASGSYLPLRRVQGRGLCEEGELALHTNLGNDLGDENATSVSRSISWTSYRNHGGLSTVPFPAQLRHLQ
jgi:hypothetical protein